MAVKRHGKRYRALIEGEEPDAAYSVEQAIERIKQSATAKFDETVDVAFRLGVDPRQSDQRVRGTVNLPHGTGKTLRVGVFARGEAATLAEQAGADVVGAEDLVQKIEAGWKEFDILVASRDMMSIVGRLGKRLGPKMPNPKAGTVTDDVAKTVRDLKGGRAEFRMDKAGNVHLTIGKASYPPEHLVENLATLVAALLKARPPATKGQYIRRIHLSSTMGPSVAVDLGAAEAAAERAA
jgi:large subunit ribosomal protein L1